MKKLLIAAMCGIMTASVGFAAFAAGPFKAVFWDENIQVNWASDHERVRDYFQAAGYTLLDAFQLAKFMKDRIADKAPSVIVFAQDRGPSTVTPEASKDVLLVKYLQAAGKIVWIADIPFWSGQDIDTGDVLRFEQTGSQELLGVSHDGPTWDTNTEIVITDAGKKWGINEVWSSIRGVSKDSVNIVLAEDGQGQAASWVKTFGGPEGTGFVRIYDRSGAPENLDWVKLVAEYGLK